MAVHCSWFVISSFDPQLQYCIVAMADEVVLKALFAVSDYCMYIRFSPLDQRDAVSLVELEVSKEQYLT